MQISLLCEPAPTAGRMNEDACFVYSDGDTVTAAAIDGATQRIDVPALYAPPGVPPITGARFAAQLSKHTLYRHVHRDPAAMILAANAALRAQLEQASAITADALARLAPQHAALLADDPRMIRLMLPVCVATVVQIDVRHHEARFAHVGDTALYVFHEDGRVCQLTDDQMGQHDDAAIEAALALKAEVNAPHLSDVVRHDRVTRINRRNGLYHNFVDASGATDTTVGVGVINGLPEIQAYVQTGTIDLSTVAGLLVCSDGFPLPAPWGETPAQAETRLHAMRDLLFDAGIAAYAAHLRALQARDHHLDRYPRFKPHDDTTGVFVMVDRPEQSG